MEGVGMKRVEGKVESCFDVVEIEVVRKGVKRVLS